MSTRKKKHRRRANHYVITISDNPKSSTHSKRHPHGFRRFIGTVIGLIVIGVFTFVARVNYRSAVMVNRESTFQAKIEELQAENAKLTEDNALLNEKIKILSETVHQKSEEVHAIEERSLPTGFPLSIAADIIERDEEIQIDGEYTKRPTLEFKAADGTYVVAAGDGIVSMVAEEITYGWEVRIDHGNGYVTSYRTGSEPKVKVDDEVSRGGLLFEMKSQDDEPAKLAYQMLHDDEYINPTELLEING